MSDDIDTPFDKPADSVVEPTAAAIGLALNAAGNDSGIAAEAREFLRKQTRYLALQMEDLHEQRDLTLSHLRWRRLNDQLKGALQLMFVATGALLVVALGVVIWSAANDHGLVVQSFSVPPDLAAQGETGDVVAAHILDRISAMESQTTSLRARSSYRNNWGEDLKVQIPDTAISFGEAYRFLVGWLGDQTRISGEVVQTAKAYAVTARVGTGAGATFNGPELEPLLNAAAEHVMSATQPYLYAVWLNYAGRQQASAKAFLSIAQSNAPAPERAWAYAALTSERYFVGDFASSEEDARTAIRLNPDSVLAWGNLAGLEELRGHDEATLKDREVMLKLLKGDAGAQIADDARPNTRFLEDARIHAALGDFASAVALQQQALDQAYQIYRRYTISVDLFEYLARVHEIRAAREFISHAEAGGVPKGGASQTLLVLRAQTEAHMALALDNWRGVVAVLGPLDGKVPGSAFLLIGPNSELAYARARLGDFPAAQALIARMPGDCYLCVRMRGNIRAVEKNWGAAAYWFDDAARQAPSMPFADFDWGAMLLAKGDYDAAIEKFREANVKGPHFADPLEMWGEALMAKNCSDLATAKFEEADKYAPNWGRLHLKWGEALAYFGNRSEAAKQFAIASHLDLSPADRSTLARVRAGHA